MDAKAFGEELIGTIESSPLEYSLRYVSFIPKTLILFKGFLPTPTRLMPSQRFVCTYSL